MISSFSFRSSTSLWVNPIHPPTHLLGLSFIPSYSHIGQFSENQSHLAKKKMKKILSVLYNYQTKKEKKKLSEFMASSDDCSIQLLMMFT